MIVSPKLLLMDKLILFHILTVLAAYLIGSVPTSVWVGKWFYKIDVRDYGSGNAGATNTFRVLGVKAGIPVLAFDVLKGWFAVKLMILTNFYYIPSSDAFVDSELLLGVAAVLGHIFPIYAKFKGGKGVATLLGVVLAIFPQVAAISIGAFVVMLLISRYVSLSSMVAGLLFPIATVAIMRITTPSFVVFSLTIAIALLLTHQQNIERLFRKEESKANLFSWLRKKKTT